MKYQYICSDAPLHSVLTAMVVGSLCLRKARYSFASGAPTGNTGHLVTFGSYIVQITLQVTFDKVTYMFPRNDMDLIAVRDGCTFTGQMFCNKEKLPSVKFLTRINAGFSDSQFNGNSGVVTAYGKDRWVVFDRYCLQFHLFVCKSKARHDICHMHHMQRMCKINSPRVNFYILKVLFVQFLSV